MIKLTHVTIHKYRSYFEPQSFAVDDKITVLVGMNESGKTAALQALAKTNYFQEDKQFKVDQTLDYPRKELNSFKRGGGDQLMIECTYEISGELFHKINTGLTGAELKSRMFNHQIGYNSGEKFLGLELIPVQIQEAENNEENQAIIEPISYEEFIRQWIRPNLPKFWYYDEYFEIEDSISLNDLVNGQMVDSSAKTAQALLYHAGIDAQEVLKSATTNFEDYVAQLESAAAEITDQIFKYWSTNPNLKIRFAINPIEKQIQSRPQIQQIVDRILNTRIENLNYGNTLPLSSRSKGFNWFFSFLVWFSQIKNDSSSTYILLLDEPGLNLHAKAQADLLRFIEDLGVKYQVIYSTHSPFMIDSRHLDRVRTVVETKNGSKITDAVYETDERTLFPLQAALGYDIAQNLFISPKNLLLEGPADLIYLTTLSELLKAVGRTGLREDITMVPMGGIDKVPSFISLFRSSNLEIVCLLDSFSETAGRQRLDDMVKHKIIHQKQILFFDEFTGKGLSRADIEDLFEPEEYLKLYNAAFKKEGQIQSADLDLNLPNILARINKHLGVARFNHYRPASVLNQMNETAAFFSSATLDRFEEVFKKVNGLFA
ncbi:MAG: AAA family ATPase [Bacteroidia bacterium]|nr:AAA family ATPase [Bacteroidia bacterium]